METQKDHHRLEAIAMATKRMLLPLVALSLGVGGIAYLTGRSDLTDVTWAAGTVVALLALVISIGARIR
ncbi:hypothetical protein [Thioclava sp. IC9]|uniref:hypothetical protein n=1 Tax=Thioclava sp. IC9 TaxID=1973007 RepID=UPI00197F4C85|nr:hypothetical protein [Thioclava sp. IC9]